MFINIRVLRLRGTDWKLTLDQGKVIAMAICPIRVHFIAKRALSCMAWFVNLHA